MEIKLDYTLEDPADRVALVEKIIAEASPEKLTNRYLEILADYISFAMDKQERKEKKILTDNRMVTVNMRETSFEGLASKFENGEDGIYGMMTNDKNIIFKPKNKITEEEIAEIPALQDMELAIEQIKVQAAHATGKRKFLLKKQLKEMYQDAYVIRNTYYPSKFSMGKTVNQIVKTLNQLDLSENITINAAGRVESDGIISFFKPEDISLLLCNYSKIKEDAYSNFWADGYYMMMDLDNLVDRALKDKFPLYYDIVVYKIDGKQNVDIQTQIQKDYGVYHSVEYISSLWRNKIPKLIALQAEKDYLNWYYTFQEKGKWKRCSKCGQIKLANNLYFSKNNTSKDHFYSQCKVCRNSKK